MSLCASPRSHWEDDQISSHKDSGEVPAEVAKRYMECDSLEEFTKSEDKIRAFAYTIVLRTLPHLKFFACPESCLCLFATRAMAHIWIRLVDIDINGKMGSAHRWVRAAKALRRTLSHVTQIKAAKHEGNARLTVAEVRALPEVVSLSSVLRLFASLELTLLSNTHHSWRKMPRVA